MAVEQAQAILLGLAVSGGCHSIRRVLLMGYCYQHQPETLKIHLSDPAHLGAAYLVKLALDSVPPQQWLPQVYNFTEGISDDWEAALLRIGHVEGWVDRQAALRHIGKHHADFEAVAMALYCLRQFPDDFTQAVNLASQSSHPASACYVGGISAARLGLAVLPFDIPARDRLLRLGRRIAKPR